jgi:hypothetical protein
MFYGWKTITNIASTSLLELEVHPGGDIRVTYFPQVEETI